MLLFFLDSTVVKGSIWILSNFSPFSQFSSVAQLCPILCDPMNRSTPGLPVHHQLPEFTQTHVHQVGDTIQPSHPLSSPSPPVPNPSQHQRLFQWVNSSHEVAKVLEFQLYRHSFQRNPRADLLQNGLVGSPCSPRDSPESFSVLQALTMDHVVKNTAKQAYVWLSAGWQPHPVCPSLSLSFFFVSLILFF